MRKESKLSKLRLILACTCLSIVVITVIVKLISLSISDGVFLKNEGKKRYIKYRNTQSVRGGIYDKNNFPLAV